MKTVKISNYKSLKHVELNSISRVNIITGRNNTGKSSLLEAMSLLVSDNFLIRIREILNYRGEILRRSPSDAYDESYYIKTISSLFNGRDIDNKIHLMSDDLDMLISLISDAYDENVLFRDIDAPNLDDNPFLIVSNKVGDSKIPLPRLVRRNIPRRVDSNFQYVQTNCDNSYENSVLWDEITLTYKEEHVIRALQIIEPRVERLSFVGLDDGHLRRDPIVKLSNNDGVFPIKSMGDGMNRILSIILALVNCQNGYLFIDEFENGLHHSVQKDLWKIIFELSKELDIQVFVTSHSEDSIRTFSAMLCENEEYSGSLYRLNRKKDDSINVNLFSRDEIIMSSNININLR